MCGYRISVILQPSKLERWVRFPLPAPYGERSSVGRAPVCGTGCRGFESHRSPHLGISPSGKAPHFDCGIRRFESCYPCHIFGLLAQSVEHLTFNQGVRSSNLRWVTREHGEVSEWFKELVLKTSDA